MYLSIKPSVNLIWGVPLLLPRPVEEVKMPVVGFKHKEESKKKISLALKGRIAWNKGKTGIFSTETLKKISESQKGKIVSEETRIKKSLKLKGRILTIHSTETRKKMSETRKGENNNNWKGGITPENKKIRYNPEFKEWRTAVYQRDYYTCQICGNKKGIRINAHHIKSFKEYPELRFDADNGITLCKECHVNIHKKH